MAKGTCACYAGRPNLHMVEGGEHTTHGVVTSRVQVIGAIRSPLAFFTLALLIVEVFLICAGKWFDLEAGVKLATIVVGVGLFIFLILVVTYLVVYHPRSLVFSEQSHVQYHQLDIYGQKGQSITVDVLDSIPVEGQPDVPAVGHQPGLPPPEGSDEGSS